jgi:HSP20 family protein
MVIRVSSSGMKPESNETSYTPSPYALFDRVFGDYLNQWANRSGRALDRGENWLPSVDVYEKDGDLVIKADIPGVDEKQIDLKLEGNILTVSANRDFDNEDAKCNFYQVEGSYGQTSRSFRLPETADHDKINASYKNGVLKVVIPSKPETASRSIKVNT